jgi:translation elongation factor EF-Tu-like GTPase
VLLASTGRGTVVTGAVALEPGLGFAIREGGRTAGAGTVVGLLD